ncbi:Hypothetical protein CINCED_3A020846 [Cinara cedri]|uniref:WD repeat-containing protein 75 second beta-propeller domain-containing protein n=1 Tax=Cinara cedri TaxID=506608 RepID=A0A5E4MXY5_9HEMI|nr:Hypothetical protein CINCED_3A020846 [Cinara cedri]
MTSITVELTKVEGGNIVRHPPLFSINGRFIYVGCGSDINCFSVDSGKLVANYIGDGNFGQIVNLCFHPSDDKVLIAIHLNGVIVFWKLIGTQAAKILKHQELDLKKCHIINGKCLAKQHCSYNVDCIFVSYKLQATDNDDIIIGLFSLENGTVLHKFNEIFENLPHIWSFGGFEEVPYFAAANKNIIHIYDLLNYKKNKIRLGSDRTVTVVQCHPNCNILSIGDNTGRIVLYYNVMHKSTRSQTVYHWHTLPVNDVVFTNSGNHFYSGGGENVLVKWFVENIETRHFLPRLPANILHISVTEDNQYIAVSTQDNGILIVNSQNRIHSTIQKFTWGVHASTEKEFEKGFPAGVAFDSRSRSLVTNGWPGHIQFFSLDQSQLSFNLDIVCQNYITQTRDQSAFNADVCLLAISDDSTWLATVERRPTDENFIADDVLKFWSFNEKLQSYSLNTYTSSVDRITKVLFRPSVDSDGLHMAATLHEDVFKLWSPYNLSENIKSPIKSWQHEYTTFGPSIILKVLDDSDDFKTSLTHGFDHIRLLQFGKNTSSWMLVAASSMRLLIWNVLSETLLTTIWVQVERLIADPMSEFMAVFTPNNDVFVFTPNDKNIIYKKENIFGKNNKNTSILWAIFAPNLDCHNGQSSSWLDNSTLYMLTNQQELIKFNKTDTLQNMIEAFVDNSFTNLTPLGRIISNNEICHNTQTIKKLPEFETFIDEDKSAFEILEEPAYLMFPLESQLERILLACLKT